MFNNLKTSSIEPEFCANCAHVGECSLLNKKQEYEESVLKSAEMLLGKLKLAQKMRDDKAIEEVQKETAKMALERSDFIGALRDHAHINSCRMEREL